MLRFLPHNSLVTEVLRNKGGGDFRFDITRQPLEHMVAGIFGGAIFHENFCWLDITFRWKGRVPRRRGIPAANSP
jgi:hypothetical protein